ncbi:MAG: hypothetical protein CME06_08695 [Gemmatimonadetes bacterium]|nr:hypothetical protein [Gemmatimonadota bacterium]
MGSTADQAQTQLALPVFPRAVLLFARAPRVEQEVKPFGPRGEEIHRALLVAVLTAIRGLPLDVDLVLAGDQERELRPIVRQMIEESRRVGDVPVFGDGFGSRFLCAVDGAIGLGYGHLVVVGGDIAEIRLRHLMRAFSLLAEGDPVIVGPSPDGGFYLLGFSSPPNRILREIPWRGPRALNALLGRCEETHVKPAFLEQVADVDDAGAIEGLRTRLNRLQPAGDLCRTISRVVDSVGL